MPRKIELAGRAEGSSALEEEGEKTFFHLRNTYQKTNGGGEKIEGGLKKDRPSSAAGKKRKRGGLCVKLVKDKGLVH